MHSVLSHGGELTPERLAADARAAGLDFLATTEHNTAAGHAAWAELGGGNGDSDTDDSGLLVLFGQEVVTGTGHWLALGLEPGQLIDGGYGVRDAVVDRQLAAVHRVGGLCVAAHPHAPYPSGTFMYPYEGFDVVEVWNGPWSSDLPWQADNEAALAEWGRNLAADVHQGRWRPAIGNSDTHLAGQMGVAHTVVAAAELTAASILDGIRAGRSWIAGSAQVWLDFSAAAGPRRAGIGERLETAGGPAVIHAGVHGVPGGTISFHTERGVAHRATLPSGGSDVVQWQTGAAESGFVRVEVRHTDRQMAALSNPITLI